MSQESRISDEEFERRLNSKSYDSQWRSKDENDRSQEQQTSDWLHGQRQQSGQTMLTQMKDFQDQKEITTFNKEISQTSNTNAENQSRLNTSRITFPKEMKFEKFISDKNNAFFYFSNHPKTFERFDTNDVAIANNLAKSRNTAYMSLYFSMCLCGYYMTKYLKYRNIPWGITYKFSFIGFFTKYFFFPMAMAGTIDKYAFAEPYQKSMDNITSKYSFTTDNIFLDIFESQKKK